MPHISIENLFLNKIYLRCRKLLDNKAKKHSYENHLFLIWNITVVSLFVMFIISVYYLSNNIRPSVHYLDIYSSTSTDSKQVHHKEPFLITSVSNFYGCTGILDFFLYTISSFLHTSIILVIGIVSRLFEMQRKSFNDTWTILSKSRYKTVYKWISS